MWKKMNAKPFRKSASRKIIAILIAGMVAMAIGIPMAMSSDQEAVTTATVGNVAPVVTDASVSPDPVTMSPCPDTTTITVTATVSDDNGWGDITNVNVTIPSIVTDEPMTCTQSNATSGTCTVDIALDCCTPATTYTATVEAKDQAGATGTDTYTFTVSSTVDITVTDVNFGNVAPGGSSTASSTVTNNGNAEIKFVDADPAGYDNPDDNDGIYWSDMTSNGNTIVDDQISTTWNSATTISCGSSDDVPFTLDVPSGTPEGTYTGTITFSPSVA